MTGCTAPRGLRRRQERGSLLLEVLVALLCTGLVAAAVLDLTVESARTFRLRQLQLDAEARTRAVLLAVAPDLRAAGAGLEGARAVRVDAERVPVVEIRPASLRLVRTVGPAREVDPEPGGRLRVDDVAGLREGDLVAALGVAAAGTEPTGHPDALAGRIDDLRRDRSRGPSGGSLRVAWGSQGPEGDPRALLPIAIREFATRDTPQRLELRRRDHDGIWQPVVDRLDGVRFRLLTPGSAADVASGSVVEVEATASSEGVPTIGARLRVVLR